MKKILKIVSLILFAAIIGGYIYIRNIKISGLADYSKNIKIEGLTDEVTVYRDEYGVPHIYAKNENDLYLVTGYLSAQDRLWQMDLLRRVTQGRLSEIFGEDLVDVDVTLRKLQISNTSKELKTKLDKEVTVPLDYFSKGVNQYIADHKDNLPFEFKVLGYEPEAWTPIHSLNMVGFMAWNLEMGYKLEATYDAIRKKVDQEHFKEILPGMDLQDVFIFNDIPNKVAVDSTLIATLHKITEIQPEIFNGSNNWVVSGKKSTTGKPIFSNDMHLGLDIPGIWTRMHQNIEGKLNVTGVILPGAPFIVAGHNDRIAWGMTNVMLDGSDFYVETINPDNKSQYKFNGEWKDMRVLHEKIFVKGKEAPVEKDLYFTHRGPIFTKFDKLQSNPVSMHWIGNEESREIDALYKVNRAGNWKEFKDAVKGFQSTSQNIAYADIDGNIGLQMTGRLPKRQAPGYLFLPGDTDKYDWKAYVPYDSLPYEYNPARGFVSSANNRTVNPDKFKYYISEWYDLPYRIKRIRQLLSAKEKLSVDDIIAIDYDHHSVQADEMKPVYIKHLDKAKKLSKEEQNALQVLKDWDNVYTTEAVAPIIFEKMYINMIANIIKDELGDEVFHSLNNMSLGSEYLMSTIFAQDGSVWCDDINTKDKKETLQDMIEKSFKQTIQQLTEEYGDATQIKWGDVHHLTLQHPLGKVKAIDMVFNLNRTISAPGCSNTVSPFSFVPNAYFDANFGASEKHIFSTADWDKSYSILPTGVSGNPISDYYCNQTDKYVKGEVLPDYFTKDIVKQKAKFTAIFTKK